MVKAGNAERTFSKAAVRDYPLADPGQVETNIGVIAAMVSADGTPGGGWATVGAGGFHQEKRPHT